MRNGIGGWCSHRVVARMVLAAVVAGWVGVRSSIAAVEPCTRVSIVTSGPTNYLTEEKGDPPRLVVAFPDGILLGQLGDRIDVQRGFVQEIQCEYQSGPGVAVGDTAMQPIRSITMTLSRSAPWRVWEEPGRIVIEIGTPSVGAVADDVQFVEAARVAAEEVGRQQSMEAALDAPMARRSPGAMPWIWVVGFAIGALGLLAFGGWWLMRVPARGMWDVAFEAPQASAVSIVGDFNNWDPSAHPLQRDANGRWLRRLRLEPGWYEYRYMVDGVWQDDPSSAQRVANPFGSANNLTEIR